MNLCLLRFTLTTSAIVLLTLTGWLDAHAFQQRKHDSLTRAGPVEPVNPSLLQKTAATRQRKK